jgi:hypothetical protein
MIPLRLYLASFDIRDIRILSLFNKESLIHFPSNAYLNTTKTKRYLNCILQVEIALNQKRDFTKMGLLIN